MASEMLTTQPAHSLSLSLWPPMSDSWITEKFSQVQEPRRAWESAVVWRARPSCSAGRSALLSGRHKEQEEQGTGLYNSSVLATCSCCRPEDTRWRCHWRINRQASMGCSLRMWDKDICTQTSKHMHTHTHNMWTHTQNEVDTAWHQKVMRTNSIFFLDNFRTVIVVICCVKYCNINIILQNLPSDSRACVYIDGWKQHIGERYHELSIFWSLIIVSAPLLLRWRMQCVSNGPLSDLNVHTMDQLPPNSVSRCLWPLQRVQNKVQVSVVQLIYNGEPAVIKCWHRGISQHSVGESSSLYPNKNNVLLGCCNLSHVHVPSNHLPLLLCSLFIAMLLC